MNINPTSHFITLFNRPIVQENGEIVNDSLKLHYWEWKGHQPTILICHGGTFHGRCYDRLINEGLSGLHVISLDFRGHGQSQKHPPPYPFRWFGEDILQFIEILNLSTTNHLLGIGHSLGGHALIYASSISSRRLFRSLLLLDPALYSPHIYHKIDESMPTGEFLLRRKYQWSSIEDMISYKKTRKTISKWPEDTIRNYCTYALDENFQLVCTPEQELSLYFASVELDSNIYEMIKKSKFINDILIYIVRASSDRTRDKVEVPPTAIDLMIYFKKSRDIELKDANHLFPMEQPDITICFIKEFIDEYKNLYSHL